MMHEADTEDLKNIKGQIESIQNMNWDEQEFNKDLINNLEDIKEKPADEGNNSN